MASCITKQWDNAYTPQAKLTVTVKSETNTDVTLEYLAQYVAYGYAASVTDPSNYKIIIAGTTAKEGTFQINGIKTTTTIATGTVTVPKSTSVRTIPFSISFDFNIYWSGNWGGTKTAEGSLSIAAKPTYTVTYDANGGTGAPSAQTKWAGETLTLSSAKPTRTGYTFANWLSTAQNKTYAAGAYYGYDADTTMRAQWTANTYTVTYNANGGSGAPANQTKTYGVNLTLSSTKPTRANYNFKGWGASASSTTVSYAAGGTYKDNAPITLYAIWELAYVKPRITNLSVKRCNSNGTAQDDGTYALVSFSWATDKTVSSITAAWSSESGGSGSKTISASGTSGTVSQAIGGSLGTDYTYNITVTVADSGGSTPETRTLNGLAFTMDALAGGKGVAFGKPAELEGWADFTYKTIHRSEINVNNQKLYGVKTPTANDEAANKQYVDTFLPKAGGTLTGTLKGKRADFNFIELSQTTPYIDFHSGSSTADYTHRIIADGTALGITDAAGGGISLITSHNVKLYSGSNFVVAMSDRFRASANDILYLGDSSNKWKAVYAVNGTIQSSDRNAKKNIEELSEKYIEFFDKLMPVSFMFNDKESDRVHIGFISQDVKAAMDEVGLTDVDFAGFCRDVKTVWDEETQTEKEVLDEEGNPVYLYSLRYSEFIALNSRMIQLNKRKLKEQQEEINTLRSELEELKKAVSGIIEKAV